MNQFYKFFGFIFFVFAITSCNSAKIEDESASQLELDELASIVQNQEYLIGFEFDADLVNVDDLGEKKIPQFVQQYVNVNNDSIGLLLEFNSSAGQFLNNDRPQQTLKSNERHKIQGLKRNLKVTPELNKNRYKVEFDIYEGDNRFLASVIQYIYAAQPNEPNKVLLEYSPGIGKFKNRTFALRQSFNGYIIRAKSMQVDAVASR
ncbi:hypothetical protein [Nonlabens ponticola]|uniref:Uncharacterized protein n=1 Tax=Nonlabens ponticola TaxID=2496866 RepID=A0A3S9MYM7_9FLAO|nr:hypothetical protein [Nonlabens ponticola]AZQ44355.1 hypothetical protein EJ995_08930 [Nonlabens ponticola]